VKKVVTNFLLPDSLPPYRFSFSLIISGVSTGLNYIAVAP